MSCLLIFIRGDCLEDKTKYNVDKETEKRTCNGVVFDSILEMRYFRDVVLPAVESGEISGYELQKPYELQQEFTRSGKKVNAIVYVADFFIRYADGSEIVIDIKGCPDTTAIIKRKLFWFRYPEIDYRWICYSKIDGGWSDYDYVKKQRSIRKRIKKEQSKEKGEKENG